MMAVSPNFLSPLYRALSPFIEAYAIQTGISTLWHFRGEAVAGRRHIKYQLLAKGDPGPDLGRYQYWPTSEPPRAELLPWLLKSIATTKFLAHPNHLQGVFVPWICKQSQDADRVSVQIYRADETEWTLIPMDESREMPCPAR